MKKLKITLSSSTINSQGRHKKTVQALGLKKIGSSVVQEDNQAIRGMIRMVNHLVTVEPYEEADNEA